MATLLSAVSTDTTGTGASHTAPATVYAYGTFDGATVSLEISDDDSNYVPAEGGVLVPQATFRGPGSAAVNGRGTYYIRAKLNNAGDNTSVTVMTTA